MSQVELLGLAARIGQGLASSEETKVFLLQLQAKIAELQEFLETLPKLA